MTAVAIASAQVINVPGDYPTIQAGINAASDEDTVLVADGTYLENINFNGKAITVASHYLTTGDFSHIINTIIDGSNPSHPDSASCVMLCSGEDTTSVIYGFTLTGGGGLYNSFPQGMFGGGVSCTESGAKIMHNRIIDNEILDYTYAGGGGIMSLSRLTEPWLVIGYNNISGNLISASSSTFGGGVCIGSSARIFENTISENEVICTGSDKMAEGGAIYCEEMGDQDDVFIYNNVMANNTLTSDFSRGAAIQVYNSQTEIVNNQIHDNQTAGGRAAGSAIGFLYISGNVLIKDNHIFNNIHNIDTMALAVITLRNVLNQNASLEILNNFIYNNQNNAENSWTAPIWLWDLQQAEITIDGNLIQNNSGGKAGGFYARDTYNYRLTNNVFSDNSSDEIGGALYFHQYNPGNITTRPVIANNTFEGNESGSYGGAIYFSSTYDSIGPLIFNNIFWDNQANYGDDIYYWGNEPLNIYNNDINTSSIVGSWDGHDNIYLDPLFGDTNCHISGGPCHNTGIHALEVGGITYSAPIIDFEGTPRPQGMYWDIGADECVMPGIPTAGDQPTNFNLKCSPNPCSDIFHLRYSILDTRYLRLEMYSANGILVRTLKQSVLQKGDYEQTYNVGDLPNGTYFIRLQAGNQVETAKVILMK